MRSLMINLVEFFELRPWALPLGIVVLGLLVYGLRDTLRLIPVIGGGWTRVWAISSVCFAESIRKRVLWIAPLAILGVILISQFQRPVDEADTVRQMLKVCLFATGLVVTVTTIILACTNLPREIDSRVIYTVVTKPTTRLEIVLGKILGFARVSAAILAIMGLFTAGYLSLTAAGLQRGIRDRLATMGASGAAASVRPTLEYYRDTGLLTARKLAESRTMQILARDPETTGEPARWMLGGEGDAFIPFRLTREQLIPPGDRTNTVGGAGVFIELRIAFEQTQKAQGRATSDLPFTVAAPQPTTDSADSTEPARFSVSILDAGQDTLVQGSTIDRGQPIFLTDPTGQEPVRLHIPMEAMDRFERWTSGNIMLVFSPLSPLHEYRLTTQSARLVIPAVAPGEPARVIEPALEIDAWILRGRLGRVGAQIRGGAPGTDPTHVGVFSYRNAPAEPDASGLVPFEFRADIERSGSDDREDALTHLQAIIRNRDTGKISDPIVVPLESNRPFFFKAPADVVAGGNFDVLVRSLTKDHYLGITRQSLKLVQANQGFGLNLIKSLFIMWLMSLLVISVAIFASTFLSWPIAIVLTIVMLLGRWGVLQLGDALLPGIGNQVATDLGFRDPALSASVSKSIEALARLLNYSAKVLPDIAQFASIEDLERGQSITPRRIWDALGVLGSFGAPIVVLAYVFMRNKEVAP